jgi:multidrug efflux pump subunit AcrA (membrane-fusion protein)
MRISSLLAPGLISVAAVCAMLCGCTPVASQPKPAELLSYADVEKDPEAAIGKKVAWTGREMEYSVSSDAQGKNETSRTYLLQSPPPSGGDLKFFVVHEETSQKTDAAKK